MVELQDIAQAQGMFHYAI